MKNLKPTEGELEILSILWNYGPSTVKFVNDKIQLRKKTVYTTTLKLMQIMFEKKLVLRKLKGRSHIYRAKHNPEDTRETVLENILEKAFDGSVSKLVLSAVRMHKLTPDELHEIRGYLSEFENANNSEH